LASGLEEICDLFAEFIQRTYTNDVWVPSDPGLEHVLEDPHIGALQFTSDEVESVMQDLDVNKGSSPGGKPLIILNNCAAAFAKPMVYGNERFSRQVEGFIYYSDIQER
jgi:hypothetical protein